ncbi:MAG: extracellular solute-binding protein [Planctomycetaceae bacterium]
MIARRCVLVILLAAGLSAWCGCGSERPIRDRQGRIIVEYWHQPMVTTVPGLEDEVKEVGDFERYLARQFMAENPDIVIRTQCLNWEDLPRKVPISVLGGRPPDVLMDFIGRTSGFWYQGVLEPLDEVIAGSEQDFQPRLLDASLLPDSQGVRRLHAVPLCGWVQVLALNRAAWDVQGLGHLIPTREDPRWTWDQFEKAMAAIAGPSVTPLGMQVASEQGDYRVLQFFWAFGAEVYHDRDYSRVALNSRQGVEALGWLVAAKQKGWIQSNAATAGYGFFEMFWQGRTVAIPSGVSVHQAYSNAVRDDKVTADFNGDGRVDMDIFYTLPPTRPGVTVSLPVATNGLAVFKQADPAKRKAVMRFVRFLSSSRSIGRYARASQMLPSRKSVGNIFSDQPAVTEILSRASRCDVADMGATSPNYYDIRKRLPAYLQAAFLGLKTPAEALAGFERETRGVLRKGGPGQPSQEPGR